MSHSVAKIDVIRYFYDGWVHLLADIDGVRLITNDVCEFLQKVPGRYVCCNIFLPTDLCR